MAAIDQTFNGERFLEKYWPKQTAWGEKQITNRQKPKTERGQCPYFTSCVKDNFKKLQHGKLNLKYSLLTFLAELWTDLTFGHVCFG